MFHRAIALAACASMVGCGSIEQTRTQARDVADQASQAAANAAPQSRPVVVEHQAAWLAGDAIAVSRPQPAILDKQVVFNVASSGSWSLRDYSDWISQNVGAVTHLSDSALSSTPIREGAATGGYAAPTNAGAGSTAIPPFPGMQMPAASPAAASTMAMPALPSAVASMATDSRPLRFTGDLKGFLDLITGRFGVYWAYRNGQIEIFKTTTHTWSIPTLPVQAKSSGSISTSGSLSGNNGNTGTAGGTTSSGTSGAGGGGSTNADIALSVNYWADLQTTAKAIAGPGAESIVDKSFGTLTVTGQPPQIERVNEWVKTLTSHLQKQVAIDVRVFKVHVNREDNYGLNLSLAVNTLYQGNQNGAKFTVTSAAAPSVTSGVTPVQFGASILSGTLSGTNAAVQALSTMGNVSQVFSRSGVTMNGQMLNLQAAQTQSYLASSQTTLTSTSGSSTALQPGSVTYGFTGVFLPKYVNDRIMLELNMTLSNLLGISTFTSNGSSIQLPSLSSATLQQSVALKPGQTLVLTGYEQQTASNTNNGVGSPNFALFGGGVEAQRARDVLAIVVTARLL
ncbi:MULTISPECIES: secretin N-terminal domain-containing protein [Ralstonia]|uniref:secretin N-terminal domain-containing protein n=1 Tax=Ralstonia TaxID=48736 RepID=UPI0004804E1A|nr:MULTISPECIES: secretin N-terminal domain-containing protein [Ralstonia]MBX4004068.1 secretin N-terminal domain-containing protein [Ralstonia pickettii]MBX4090344.1 secretin N-terminal domain-containing protein [Ralstonia pickettii]MBX4118471.1 secretin N-terminal domain-containing protein [Ralstonia pickettii]